VKFIDVTKIKKIRSASTEGTNNLVSGILT